MAGVDVDFVQRGGGLGIHAARPHEAQGAIDLVGEGLEPLALGAAGHELLGPRVDPGQVGEAALGEGPQQVQRRGRLVVGLHQPLRVRQAGGHRRRLAVDDVAPEARQLGAVHDLGGRGAGLGELAGDAADLHDGHPDGVGEHHRHLQDHPELLPDADRGEVVEALGAVAGLEEEGVAGRHLGERALQGPSLAGEDQRRVGADLLDGALQVGLVGPVGLLCSGEGPPRRRGPWACHGTSVPGRAGYRNAVTGRAPMRLRTRTGRRSPGGRTAAAGRGGGPRGDPAARWGTRSAQATRIRAASSRRSSTARLTSRRAASAVTPRSSPTSRKLFGLAVEEAEPGLHGVAGPTVERVEQLVEQLPVDPGQHGRLGRDRHRRRSGRPGWRRRRRPRHLSSDTGVVRRCSWAFSGSSSSPSVPVWRSAARRLAARSPGMRTRLAFWSRARPMAWRIQKVA